MTSHQIFVENIKCRGGITRIKTALQKIKGVNAVEIFEGMSKVCVTGVAVEKEEMITKLASLGYPQKGGNSFLNKAKSFVNCLVGRISSNNQSN